MKNIDKIIEIIEENNISVHEYEENNILCGYELNTYTDAGVNEIIFLDFREENQDPKNVNDFIKEFKSYMKCYPIDERIDNNRQDPKYKEDFTLKQSLKDFSKWYKKIEKLIKELEKITQKRT